MAVPNPALLTADDYRALPDDGPRYQLVQGELHMAPAPNRYHQDISRNLVILLGTFVEERQLGKLYCAPFDVYLTLHDVYQPDIVYYAPDRLSLLARDGAHGAPTLVIEILSPSTSRLDRAAKKRIYVSTGVEELWLIAPEPKTIELYRLQENPDTPTAIHRESDLFTSLCLPGLSMSGAAIFKA